MKYIQYILGAIVGVILSIAICFLIYKMMIIPAQKQELKRLEIIIQEQNKTIEKLGSVEKYKYEYDIHNQNKIKNK